MRIRSIRAVFILGVLVLALPELARATTDTIGPSYDRAEAWHYEQGGLRRSETSASGTASKSGAVQLSASVDGKLGASVPFVTSAYASSGALIFAHHDLAAQVNSVTYTVHVHVNSAQVTGANPALEVYGGGAIVVVYAQATCGDCYSSSDDIFFGPPDGRISDQDFELRLSVDSWSGDPLPSSIPIDVSFSAEARGGMRKSSWAASIDAVVTGIDATY